MKLKDFKILARKLFDINGFEHVGIKFDHSIDSGAWTIFPRNESTLRYYDAVQKVMKQTYHKEMNEYATVTFSLEYVRHGEMADLLHIIFHEICHMKRGFNDTAKYAAVGRYADEMDCDHDFEWMKLMWKHGYEGRPMFDDNLRKLQEKVLEKEGFVKTGLNIWKYPSVGYWSNAGEEKILTSRREQINEVSEM